PSFGIAAGHISRLEQARNAVPATNRQWFWPRIWPSKGSGNADSQRKVRSSGWSGQGCLHDCPRDSGCDRAHPPWRASASYRPLRAVWAFAPGHSGVRTRSPDPSAPIEPAHDPKGTSEMTTANKSEKDRVIVFDTTLRDGEQCPGATMTFEEKLEIAEMLDDMGVDVIE